MSIKTSQSVAYNRPQTKAAYELEILLDYLKRSRGFDFSAYKRPGLMRWVLKRMQIVKSENFRDYINYLKLHPEEFTQLFDTLFINVTCFFRDRSVWDYLSKEIVPQIVAGKTSNEPIRVWSAGCASGEEAYSLAIVLAEALGIEQFRKRVKIYATDIDDDALNIARKATYTASKVSMLPARFLEKYFSCSANRYKFREELRGSLVFGRHNLIEDAPISGVDLVMCRNVLMYFNSEAQSEIVSRFHDVFNENCFFIIGQAERIYSRTNIFQPVDLSQRVYIKLPNPKVEINAADLEDVECIPKGKLHICASGDDTIPSLNTRSLALAPMVKPFLPRSQSTPESTIDSAQMLLLQEELKTLKQERIALKAELYATEVELRSTSEELQVMNQELQAIATELGQRNEELYQVKKLLIERDRQFPVES